MMPTCLVSILYIYIYICIYIYIYCMYIYIHIHASHTHTHIHVYIYIYIYRHSHPISLFSHRYMAYFICHISKLPGSSNDLPRGPQHFAAGVGDGSVAAQRRGSAGGASCGWTGFDPMNGGLIWINGIWYWIMVPSQFNNRKRGLLIQGWH